MGIYYCNGCEIYHDSKDGLEIMEIEQRLFCEESEEAQGLKEGDGE